MTDPRASAASAASAAARAGSASTSVIAPTCGFTSATRARCASSTSRLDTSRVRIAVASASAPRHQRA